MNTVAVKPVSDLHVSWGVDAIAVGDRRLSVGDVLRSLHRQGHLRSLLQEAAEENVLCVQAACLGFSVSDQQLQAAADGFRRRQRLFSVQDMQAWLQSRQLTELDFEELILHQLRNEFVFAHVTRSAEDFFRSEPRLWDWWSYRELVVGSESLAEELRCQHVEEGVSFEELWTQHGAGAVQGNGAALRSGFFALLPPWIRAVMSGAVPGILLGPLCCASGWALVIVEAVSPAIFNERTEAAIRTLLYRQWFAARLNESAISYPLLDLIACQNES